MPKEKSALKERRSENAEKFKIKASKKKSIKRDYKPIITASELKEMEEHKMVAAIEAMNEFINVAIPLLENLNDALGIDYRPKTNKEAYRIQSIIKRATEEYYDKIKNLEFLEGLSDSGYEDYPYKVKDDNGYIILYDENLRFFRAEHRHLVELHLGRKLDRNEVIHHINGVKDDNRIENLAVMDKSDHSRLHGFGNRRKNKPCKQQGEADGSNQ